jgi:hypothetical protein
MAALLNNRPLTSLPDVALRLRREAFDAGNPDDHLGRHLSLITKWFHAASSTACPRSHGK